MSYEKSNKKHTAYSTYAQQAPGFATPMMDIRQLIELQKHSRSSVERLWSDHQPLWQSLGFNQSQVALWLASLPINRLADANPQYQTTPDIAEHVVTLLQQAGKPLPIAQVLKKLPAGITCSEQQIKKLAQQHPKLQVKGPLVVLNQ